MLCCGRQLQLCSVKNKTQLSHTVYHSLQQLFLSGGFFYFKTQPTVNSVTSSLPMCCWVHIALYRRLYRASMESMMGFFLFCLTHHFHWKLPYPIQKQTWQLHRWEDTNWLIFFQCSGLRTMNYIQYVRLLMILFKSVQCFEIEKPPQASLWWYIHRSVNMKLNRLHPLLFLISYVLVCIWRFWLEFSV